jgi:hypothetical protein
MYVDTCTFAVAINYLWLRLGKYFGGNEFFSTEYFLPKRDQLNLELL